MILIARYESILLTYARTDHGGRLCGCADVAACLTGYGVLRPVQGLLPDCKAVTSLAPRCWETVESVFPDREYAQDERLRDQGFGGEACRPSKDLPDKGPLSLNARKQPALGLEFGVAALLLKWLSGLDHGFLVVATTHSVIT